MSGRRQLRQHPRLLRDGAQDIRHPAHPAAGRARDTQHARNVHTTRAHTTRLVYRGAVDLIDLLLYCVSKK